MAISRKGSISRAAHTCDAPLALCRRGSCSRGSASHAGSQGSSKCKASGGCGLLMCFTFGPGVVLRLFPASLTTFIHLQAIKPIVLLSNVSLSFCPMLLKHSFFMTLFLLECSYVSSRAVLTLNHSNILFPSFPLEV